MFYIKLVYLFWISFVYSNLNYVLVIYILEKFGGKSWEDLIYEELFQLLGMDSFMFVLIILDFFKVVIGYRNGLGF